MILLYKLSITKFLKSHKIQYINLYIYKKINILKQEIVKIEVI